MNCAWKGCEADATHYPKIMVPTWNIPIQKDMPLTCIMGLTCCFKHAVKFDPHHFLDMKTPQGNGTNKDVFTLIATSSKRPPPDFKRVFILPIPIGSEEAMAFDSSRKANVPDQSVPAVS